MAAPGKNLLYTILIINNFCYLNIVSNLQIVFYNTNDKEESLNDDKAFVSIARKGQSKLSPNSDLHKYQIFKGSDNPITITRSYSKNFICEFDMAYYPFDTQVCSIIIVTKGNLGSFNQISLTFWTENIDQLTYVRQVLGS